MNLNEKLSSFHIAILIYMTQSGIVLFSLPGLLAEYFGANGWIALFGLSAIVMINIYLISLVYKWGKGDSVFVILERSIPKLLLYPFYFMLVALWSLLGCLVGKQYVLIFQMLSFPTTNPMLLKGFFDLCALLLLFKGIYNIGKAATVFFFLTIWMVGLQVFHIPEIEFSRYTTFFMQGGKGWVKGTLDIYNAFLGYELSILFIPFINKQSKFIKSVLIGNVIVTLVYVSIAVTCFGFYSYQQLGNMLFPVLDLLSYIQLPFIERIENLLFALFLLKTLFTSLMYYWAAQQVLKRIFKKVDEKVSGFFLIVVAYIVGFIPEVLTEVGNWLKYLAYSETAVAFGLPIVVLFVLLIQRMRRGRSE